MRQEFLQQASMVFEKEKKASQEVDLEQLYAKIGRLELEKDRPNSKIEASDKHIIFSSFLFWSMLLDCIR